MSKAYPKQITILRPFWGDWKGRYRAQKFVFSEDGSVTKNHGPDGYLTGDVLVLSSVEDGVGEYRWERTNLLPEFDLPAIDKLTKAGLISVRSE